MVHVSRIFFKTSDIINHPIRNYPRYPGIERIDGIAYVEGGGAEQSLDLYFDPALKPEGGYPVFVNVHGGGFVCGDKKYRSAYARFVASCGFFVLNVNYRLAPRAVFPAPTEDILLALQFLKDKLAAEYSLRLDKVVLSGDSAGGFWAAHAMAALHSEELRARLHLPDPALKPRALLTYCAPFQLRRVWETVAPLGVPADVCNCVLGTDFDKVTGETELPYEEEQNVINFITPEWRECYLIAAEKDSFCGGQVDDMEAALKEKGVPVRVYRAKERGDKHCTHLYPFLKGSKKQAEAARAFLKEIYEEE